MRPHYVFTLLFLLPFSDLICLGQASIGSTAPSLAVHGYSISGTVRDSDSGEPIPGVRVELLSRGASLSVAFTSSEGEFGFDGVPNGEYVVRAEVQGFETTEQTLSVSRAPVFGVTVDIKKLNAAPGAASGSTVSVHQLNVPSKAQKEFDKAMDLITSKADYRGGIAEFDRAIQDYPDYYEAYAMEGAAYMAISDATSAEKALRKSVDLSESKYPAALYLLAGFLNSAGRFAEAESTARQCVGVDESSWHGHFELARALLGLQQPDEARKSALRARDLKADNPKVFLLLANIDRARHDYAAFLEDLDGYLALEPTGPTADEIRKTRDQVEQAVRDAQSSPTSSPPAQ